MRKDERGAISTSIVIVIIVVLVIAAIGGIYLASQNHSTSTTTVTQTGTGSTITTTSLGTTTETSTVTSTTSTISSSGSSSNEIIDGIVGAGWGQQDAGNDPRCGWTGTGTWYNDNFEQLFQWDPADMAAGTYVPVPWLASNYTESANGLTYVINLHQGVKFHSGNTMTSADVVYSFDSFLFAKNQSSAFINCPAVGLDYASSFASMKSIAATGTYQVTLTLNHPDPLLLNELANQGFTILDSVLLKAHTVVTGSGATATSDWGFTYLDSGVAGSDAGTGPFTMTSFTYEQRAELQSFSGYWGGPFGNYTDSVKTIIMVPYTDATTAQFALEQGQINLVQDETPDTIASFASTPGYSVITSSAFEWQNMVMHVAGPLSNWEVRQAVKDAINYTALYQSLSDNYAKSDASFFGIGMQGFNATTADALAKAGPNVTGAEALLKAAGYSKGFNLNLYGSTFVPFGIPFVNMMSIIQSDLAVVNITATIQISAPGAWFATAENASLPGIWFLPTSLIYLSPTSQLEDIAAFGSSNSSYYNWSAKTETGPGVPLNQLITLFNESTTAATPALQTQYLNQLDQLYLKYGPSITIMQVSDTVAYASNIHGLVWNSVSDSFYPFSNLSA